MKYAYKILIDNPLQFLLTVLGIALCTMLMLLLLSIYKGVAVGSVQYVRSCDSDLWVMQRYRNNILRSNSYLNLRYGETIKRTEGVKTVTPIFFLLVNVNFQNVNPTVYLVGYNVENMTGGPPSLFAGRNVTSEKEIVIDRSFARKYNIGIGDRLPLKKDSLLVTGISAGTNMFVIQYAFVSLQQAWSIAGIKDYVSCYQVKLKPGASKAKVAENIIKKLGNTAVYDQSVFVENNLKEMESGLLPLLFVVAVISAFVLTAILSLILTIQVLEKRREYAILKAIGAPKGFIPLLIIKQSLVLSTLGSFIAILLFFPFTRLVEMLTPEVSTQISILHIVVTFAAVEILGIVSVLLPVAHLKSIYPMEVFH